MCQEPGVPVPRPRIRKGFEGISDCPSDAPEWCLRLDPHRLYCQLRDSGLKRDERAFSIVFVGGRDQRDVMSFAYFPQKMKRPDAAAAIWRIRWPCSHEGDLHVSTRSYMPLRAWSLASREKRDAISWRASCPRRRCSDGSFRMLRTCRASPSASSGGANRPLSPSLTTSGMPPTEVATTGIPWPIASKATLGNPSLRDGMRSRVS